MSDTNEPVTTNRQPSERLVDGFASYPAILDAYDHLRQAGQPK